MAIKRMLIGGQLLAVDDQTGELGVKVSGITFDKDIDIGDAHLLDKSDQKINPATTEDIAAAVAAQDTSNEHLAEIALLQRLLRGKMTLASGVTLTCTANATNYTQAVVAGATYRITAGSGRILLGEADTTSAANVLMVVMPGQTVLYQAQSTSLHYSTVDGDGITAWLSRVDMA